MANHTDDDIRDRAYTLWIEAGSPDGRDLEFWHNAERELAETAELDVSEAKADISLPPLPAGTIAR